MPAFPVTTPTYMLLADRAVLHGASIVAPADGWVWCYRPRPGPWIWRWYSTEVACRDAADVPTGYGAGSSRIGPIWRGWNLEIEGMGTPEGARYIIDYQHRRNMAHVVAPWLEPWHGLLAEGGYDRIVATIDTDILIHLCPTATSAGHHIATFAREHNGIQPPPQKTLIHQPQPNRRAGASGDCDT